MTTRLSSRSRAGTARTDVAVGTASDDSMLATTRAADPRSGTCSPEGGSATRACGCGGLGGAGDVGKVCRGCGGAAGGDAGGGATGGGAASASADGWPDGARPDGAWPDRCPRTFREQWGGVPGGRAGDIRSRGGGRGHRPCGRGRPSAGSVLGDRGRVVGEEVVPGRIDAVRVRQVLLVDFVDQPLVRAEVRRGEPFRGSHWFVSPGRLAGPGLDGPGHRSGYEPAHRCVPSSLRLSVPNGRLSSLPSVVGTPITAVAAPVPAIRYRYPRSVPADRDPVPVPGTGIRARPAVRYRRRSRARPAIPYADRDLPPQ